MKNIFAANWKLNKTPNEARAFLTELKTKLAAIPNLLENEIIIFPTALSFEATAEILKESKVKFGLQNCYTQATGAYTGENSASMAKSMGSQVVLIGHSERRQLFAESSESCADKVNYVQSLDMSPMLCIGETLEEREGGKTHKVCYEQLRVGLSKAHANKQFIIAYEPVWAIGTGKVASVEQVAETHADIYTILKELGFKDIPILYGGSVKPENAKALKAIPYVSGFLVGGASLNVDSFLGVM